MFLFFFPGFVVFPDRTLSGHEIWNHDRYCKITKRAGFVVSDNSSFKGNLPIPYTEGFRNLNVHIKGGIEMQTNPVGQNNYMTQAAPVVPTQTTQPVQVQEPQKPQAPQKDDVVLSQAAKDMAAQATQQTAAQPPATAMQEGGITNVIK